MPDKCEAPLNGTLSTFLAHPPSQTKWWSDYKDTHNYVTTETPNSALLTTSNVAREYTKSQKFIPNSGEGCDAGECYFYKAPNYNNLLQYGRESGGHEFPKHQCGNTGKGCVRNGVFTGWVFGGSPGDRIHYAVCGNLQPNCPSIGKYTPPVSTTATRNGRLRQDKKSGADTQWETGFHDNVKCSVPRDAIQHDGHVTNLETNMDNGKVPRNVGNTLIADYCVRTTGSGTTLDYPNIGSTQCINFCYEQVNTNGVHKPICMTEKARERWLRNYCTTGGDPGILNFDAPGKSICEDECHTPAGLSNWCVTARNTHCQAEYNRLKRDYDTARNQQMRSIRQENSILPVPECTIL